MASEVKIGTAEVRKIGESTYLRIPLHIVKGHNIIPGLTGVFSRTADGKETVIRIADEVGDGES